LAVGKERTNVSAKTEPLIKAMRKEYRVSVSGAVDKLLNEERKWRRRETIAQNKLAEIREDLRRELQRLAAEADKVGKV
jgi:hypothetical protein